MVVVSISSIAPNAKEQHFAGEGNMLRAAKEAGVKYFIPSEYGGDARLIAG